MSIVKCPECGEKISSQSKICVHCGYRDREVRILVVFLILSYLFSIIGLFFVAGLIFGTISVFLSYKVLKEAKKQTTKFFSITAITIAIGVVCLSFYNAINNLRYSNNLNAISIIGTLMVPYIIAIIYWAILRLIASYGIKEKFKSLIAPLVLAILPVILIFFIASSEVINFNNIISVMIISLIFSIPSIIRSIKKNK